MIIENKEEEWRVVPNFSMYSCSKSGEIKNNNRNTLMKSVLDGEGYAIVNMKQDDTKHRSMRVHRIVALTWIPNPDNKLTVNHKNRIRNDNRLDNLEWATHSEQNTRENKYIPSTTKQNEAVWKCDLKTGVRIQMYESIKDAAAAHNSNRGVGISNCVRGKAKSAYGFKWVYDNGLFDIATQSHVGELWKPVDNKFKISNHGRLLNNDRLAHQHIKNGYANVNIYHKAVSVHRLVAKHFITNPNNCNVVNHIDGNKLNNKASNLEYCTSSENAQHAVNMGLNSSIKKVVQYNKDTNAIIHVFNSMKDAGSHFGKHPTIIGDGCLGKQRSYDQNGDQIYLKYLAPTDDIPGGKIDPLTIPVAKRLSTAMRKGVQINVYDNKTGELLGTYATVSEIIRKYKVDKGTIAKQCNGNRKYIKIDYRFAYAE
jgi:hypothetical protein